MAMREAFISYFQKLWNFTEKRYGASPSVTYTESLNKALLISTPDNDEEVNWQPIWQPVNIEWNTVEGGLGFRVNEELRSYFGTCFFLTLSGIYEKVFLNFYPIDGTLPVSEVVCRAHSDAKTVFPDSEMFLIGNAVINDDDSYFIYYDNTVNAVFCYDAELGKRVDIGGNISNIIGEMEARD